MSEDQSGPPSGPPSGPRGALAGNRMLQRPVWLPYAGAAVVAVIIGWLVFGGNGDKRVGSDASTLPPATEIFLEPAESPGIDPFTRDVERNAVPTTVPTVTTTTGTTIPPTSAQVSTSTSTLPRREPNTAISARRGNEPGLYGGTRDNSSCDQELMVSYLNENPDKAVAWAGVQGIPLSQLSSYVRSLTPVILRQDTRVTNHGFKFGRATSNQSVLQAGTAVLVDAYGVPRARCKCGNPLAEPIQYPPVYRGDPWSWWNPSDIVVYRPAPVRVTIFILISVTRGGAFSRPAGTSGATDRDAPPDWTDIVITNPTTTTTTRPPATSTTGTTTTATTRPPTTSRPSSVDITSLGNITISSSSPGFGGALAVDGRVDTSWFSDGRGSNDPFPDAESFGWSLGTSARIDVIEVVGNGAHPRFPTGYGFASVTVEVYNSNNGVVFTETVPYPHIGSVVIRPGVVGVGFDIILNGHESADCGGFSELYVTGHVL